MSEPFPIPIVPAPPVYDPRTPAPSDEFDPRGVLEVLWRRKWIMLSVAVLVTAFGIFLVSSKKKIYSSQTDLVVAEKSPTGGGAQGVGDTLMDSLSALTGSQNVATQAAILKSPDLMTRAFMKLTPKEKAVGFGDRSRTSPPSWSYAVDFTRDTQVITVATEAYDPRVAAHFANLIAQTYLATDLARTKLPARQGRLFIHDQLATLKGQLRVATENLAVYQKNSKLIVPDQQGSDAVDEIFQLRTQSFAARQAQDAAKLSLASIQASLKKAAPEVDESRTLAENPEFARTRDQLGSLNDQLVIQSREFKPGTSQIKKLKEQIAGQEQRLNSLAHTVVSSEDKERNPLVDSLLNSYATNAAAVIVARDQLSSTDELLKQREDELVKMPDKARQYADLVRQVDALSHTCGLLTDRYYELLIVEESNIPNALVSSKAIVDGNPTSPDVKSGVLLSMLAGLVFGWLAALFAERTDSRLHDPGAFEKITGLPTLAAIPDSRPMEANGMHSELLLDRLESPHAFLEAFRLLRNNLAFIDPDRPKRIFGVTSSTKGEGKTTVSGNLAIALGLDGKRVILLDSDLRRPSVHKLLSLSREIGFTNIVAGTCSLEDAIQPTEFEGVSAITSGPLPPRPSEFLNSQNARMVVKQLAEMYDVVIVDSPPCTGLSDFQVISTFVDGVLFVSSVDRTIRGNLVAAMRMLRQANAPLLGIVINRLSQRWSPYAKYSDYYYYYYSYYGDEDEKGSGRRNSLPRKKNREKSLPRTKNRD